MGNELNAYCQGRRWQKRRRSGAGSSVVCACLTQGQQTNDPGRNIDQGKHPAFLSAGRQAQNLNPWISPSRRKRGTRTKRLLIKTNNPFEAWVQQLEDHSTTCRKLDWLKKAAGKAFSNPSLSSLGSLPAGHCSVWETQSKALIYLGSLHGS